MIDSLRSHRPSCVGVIAAAFLLLLLTVAMSPAQEGRPANPGPRLVPVQTSSSPQRHAEIWTAPWCGYCRDYAPIAQALRRQGFDVRFIDYDANRELAKEQGVHVLPTTRIMWRGTELDRLTGVVPAAKLSEALSPVDTQQAGYQYCQGVPPGAPFRSPPIGQPVISAAPAPQPKPDPRVDQLIQQIKAQAEQMQQQAAQIQAQAQQIAQLQQQAAQAQQRIKDNTVDFDQLVQAVAKALPPFYIEVIDPTNQFAMPLTPVHLGGTLQMQWQPTRLQE